MTAKHKKKRNKKYQGADAKVTAPKILRVEAEERSRFKEWWLVYGQLARLAGTVVAIFIVITLLIVGIIGLL